MSAPSSLGQGDVIAGRYVVERMIGKGGMGAVYAAKNQMSGRKVALKVIKATHEETPEQRRRFLREAKTATAIAHPNVIEVLDVFEDDHGTLVMVMELLDGETLKDFRQRHGAVTLHEAATIFLPITEALSAAHEKGIVHRDLKPENVFLAQKGGERVPTILDFGIAKVLDPATLHAETQGQQTATGSLLGTPHYMSYEQAMSDKVIDQRADVWAVGVMLFELLTGRRPIEFENLGEMYTAFITGTIPSIRDCIAELPDDAAEAIDRCLVKEREGRLEGVAPLARVLARYVEPEAEGGDAGGRVLAALPRQASPRPAPSAETSSTAGLEASLRPVAPRSMQWGLALGAIVLAGGMAAYLASAPDAAEGESPVPAASAHSDAAAHPTVDPTVELALDPAASPPSPPSPSSASSAEALPHPTAIAPAPSGGPAPKPVSLGVPRPKAPPQTAPSASATTAPAPEPHKPGLAKENPYGGD